MYAYLHDYQDEDAVCAAGYGDWLWVFNSRPIVYGRHGIHYSSRHALHSGHYHPGRSPVSKSSSERRELARSLRTSLGSRHAPHKN